MRLDRLGGVVERGAVLAGLGADEDAGAAAAQGHRIQPGPFQGLPGDLHQHPLLRVHGQGLTRGDAEEGRVETGHVVEETAAVQVAGLSQGVQVPAPVAGQAGDDLLPGDRDLPEVFG
ncbi:hypothetical protein Kisp01_35820 [Kineosporia sp. NBRC 101677]|nr:hypothetical protein Kisp01_35820 [Kineosporia sp. NBRC 101677]